MFMMKRNARLLFVILACAGAIATASPRQNSPQNNPQTPPAGADNKIYLDVVVSPKNGAPVGDLQQQDFTVLDNKSPQAITSFQAVTGREAPISVTIVLDAVNDDYRTLTFSRMQISKFLRAEGGRLAYPVDLVVFTDKGMENIANYSTDGNALSATLDSEKIGLRFITRSGGFYGAAERLGLSTNATRQLAASLAAHPGRNIVLWASPGWPILSGPGVQLSNKEEDQLFADVVNFTNLFRAARLTLYAINPLGSGESVFRGTYYEEFLKGVTKPSQVVPGNIALQVLALQSGGEVLDFNNDMAALLQKCISNSAPYYEISFVPQASERSNEYHQIEIKIAKGGLTARTRQGYYAQPQHAPQQ
ncbi:MAG: VWA domain-containing protein [Candidatus Acidiferrales bacterium]